MAYEPDPAKSIRDNIILHLMDRLRSMRADGREGYSVTWNRVLRSELTPADIGFAPVVALLELPERKTAATFPYTHCTLPLEVEFRHPRREGDDVRSELLRLMTDVVRAMTTDPTCGGLATDLVETGNDLDPGQPEAKHVGGIVSFSLTYRHRHDDPRSI
ncbi:hypothetical protein [Azospirillum argentinense]|uniref:hypothetical protein n=1 Tax=Azospirillum argentinense TaxID=2970906 RepID=UPI0032DEDB2F